ncbi:hypothetical protein CRYUN_Cryun01aG0095700 [Craigia yunnanensis]
MYSDELLKRLASELSGILETAVLLWMHDPVGRDAIVIRQVLLANVTNLDATTEVIGSRTPSQIQVIKQTYNSKFGVFLEQDIEGHSSGDHQNSCLHMSFIFCFGVYQFSVECPGELE